MAQTFLERLAAAPLLADGAMGTLLYSRGASFEQSFDGLNVTRPDLVRAIHRDYVVAGARLIETNTFGANALRLAEQGLEDRVRAINLAGARLAREVADAFAKDPNAFASKSGTFRTIAEATTDAIANAPDAPSLQFTSSGFESGSPASSERVWVAGSVGPLGVTLAPLGTLPVHQARAAFVEQMTALADGGVDLLILETMGHLGEALTALEAAREVCSLPVVVHLTFGEDGLTATGRRPEEVVRALEAAGADVIGANCSTGPAMMLDVMARMASASRTPLSAMPNAGLPAIAGGRYVYTSSPAYMGEVAAQMVEAGVALVGGCCGTTPEHIEAMREALLSMPEGRIPAVRPAFLVIEEVTTLVRGRPSDLRPAPTGLQRALADGRFVVTVEVDPPRGFSFEGVLPKLRTLKECGYVDAIDVADNPRARACMSALAMGVLVQNELGLEAVLHMGVRHRNLIATHSDLLGAHALGIRNVFVVMGDLPVNGDYPDATVNKDLTATGLMQLLTQFNRGSDMNGRALEAETSFHIGCAFNFGAPDLAKELALLETKIASGAAFALSQPVYEPRAVEVALTRLGGRFPIPLILGILPLWNARHANFLHNEVPGINIPDAIRSRMARDETKGRDVGVAVAREVLGALDGAVQGAYFMPPFERFDMVPEIMSGLNLRSAMAKEGAVRP